MLTIDKYPKANFILGHPVHILGKFMEDWETFLNKCFFKIRSHESSRHKNNYIFPQTQIWSKSLDCVGRVLIDF